MKWMTRLALIGTLFSCAAQAQFRPPAVPLVTHDPYFSCWSTTDHLYDDFTKHWTGKYFGMAGLIRVDGKTLRFMGKPPEIDAVTQTSVTVTATQSIYTFDCGRVDLTVRFISPLIIDDLELVSRPATYVVYSVKSKDNAQHEVQIYFDASGEWAVNDPSQPVTWARVDDVANMNVLSIRSVDQKVLAKKGDDLRIDWGTFYVAAAADQTSARFGSDAAIRKTFVDTGKLPNDDDLKMPRPAKQDWPVMSLAFDLGQVGGEAVERHQILAYDDVQSIQYLGTNLPAWWRRSGNVGPNDLIKMADADYASVREKCDAFDKKIHAEAEQAGGEKYAEFCDLLYRHSISAHKLVANTDGRPFFFSKENFSNGCIATVDVTFPSSALYLAYNPALIRGMIDPIFDYCAGGRWKFPFAPHDLGTYPLANGQVYGGGERTEKDQMPVEETGNMLILTSALCLREGNGDYAKKNWKQLTTWKDYLVEHGLDPANQLCTDDFSGPLPRNANLSVKAILGIAGYAKMAEMIGLADEAKKNLAIAHDYAAKWQKLAETNGDHYALAFGRKDTWSMKYNLVWNKILGVNVFPKSVIDKELAYYQKQIDPFGLRMDNREHQTKPEYICMVATLCDNREDADRMLAGIYRYVNETPSRVPMSDWHDTVSGRMRGFQARSVVGGVWMQVLAQKMATPIAPAAGAEVAK